MQRPFKQPDRNDAYFLPKGGIQVLDGNTTTMKDIKAAVDIEPEPAEEGMELMGKPALVIGVISTASKNLLTGINAVTDASGKARLCVEKVGDTYVSTINGGTADVHLNGAANSPTIATVTTGTRWRIKFVSKGGSVGNTYIYITTNNLNTGTQIYLSGTSTAASSTSYDFVLESGTNIFMMANNNGADVAVPWGLVYEVF